jgi:uncharacterized membrane-anchored protein
MPSITDHPLRFSLANELHARPFPSLSAPCVAVFLAVKQPMRAIARDRGVDRAHLLNLLDRFGAVHPSPNSNHYFGKIGRHILKWESHSEFVTYTVFIEHLSERAFDPADFEVFPADWLSLAPGVRITSALIRIETRNSQETLSSAISDWFVGESVAVARVLGDTATIAGDFRIDAAGHSRFAVSADKDIGKRSLGRVVQRLCEIETYKTMSMLGFSRVGEMSGRMGQVDVELTRLIEEMSGNTLPAQDTLMGLLKVSAELEAMVSQASFRFSATHAYEEIVVQRIEVLREERFEGRQTFEEFMSRRYTPAMRTVSSAEVRLRAMADRAMRAGDLLRTRVDVERSTQNQSLLESMDRRADAQLRLQRTVEGLSVVAISYYAVSLAAYLLYPAAEMAQISRGVVTAGVTLPIVGIVWWAMRQVRKRLD